MVSQQSETGATFLPYSSVKIKSGEIETRNLFFRISVIVNIPDIQKYISFSVTFPEYPPFITFETKFTSKPVEQDALFLWLNRCLMCAASVVRALSVFC